VLISQKRTLNMPSYHLLPSNHTYTKKYITKKVDLVSNFKSFSNIILNELMPIVSTTTRNISQVHPSYSNLFISTSAGGLSMNSTRKIFRLIYNYYLFIYKLEYYNLTPLYFSNPFFKNEVTYLNNYSSARSVLFTSSLKSIFFKKKTNKLHNYQIFSLLKASGYSTSLIFDVSYHQKTVTNLTKLGFFLLGPLPVYMPKYTLNIALPLTNDSFTAQLVLVRSLFLIKKKIAYTKYDYYLN